MPQSISLVAALFGDDRRTIAEYVLTVPADLEETAIVDQVLQLARAEGVLTDSHGTVMVALREADEDDLEERGDRPTIH